MLDVERGATTADRRRLRSRSCCPTGPSRVPVPRYRMPRGAEAVGRLLRRAGHGPDRSVHRIRRHARRHHRGHAARRCRRGRRCAWRSCRSTIGAAALGVRHAAARRGARDLAHARPARHRRLGHRAHGRALPRAAARGRRRSRASAFAIPAGRRDRAARHARAAARHDRAERASTRSAARASRRRPTRRWCASAALLDEAGVLDAVEIAVPGDRARAAAAARAARGGAGRRSTRASAARSTTSTRASRRPPPT